VIRINHLLKELGKSLFRNVGTAFSSFLSLMLLFLLFDIYWIGASTSDRFYTDMLSDLRMEAFVSEDVADSTVPIVENNISMIEGVFLVEYISKEQAREELSRLVGSDLLIGYDTTNPLPRSFILSFSTDYLNSGQLKYIEAELTRMPEITEVFYNKSWLEKAEMAKTIILNAGLALGALILLAALIGSANNIRLMTRTRAVGFKQMQLLGAGRLFLATPFLMEGLLIGGLSALSGWLLVFYWKGKITFTQFELVYPVIEEIVIYCVAAALLGVISGYLGIRKLLRT